MHKLLTLALVAKACSRAVVTGTAREAVGRGMVVASPEAASRFEYFGFDGSGWQSQESLRVCFISSSGEQIALRGFAGSDAIITGSNGEFTFAIRPVENLASGALGTWTAQFETRRGVTTSVTFRIVAG